MEIVRVHDIQPPMPEKKVRYQKNYNHINNIIRHEGKFYVNLNWLTKCNTQPAEQLSLIASAH